MIRESIRLLLAQGTQSRIDRLVNQSSRVGTAKVLGWSPSAQAWQVQTAKGNTAYVRNIANSVVGIGDKVSLNLDKNSSLGWIDAKPR